MRGKLLPIALAGAVLLAGCGFTDPGPGAEIYFSEPMDVSNGTFQMQGDIAEGGGHGGKDVYRNVVVCLYSEDGILLNKSEPQDISGRSEVSVSADSIPRYVVINSSSFWDASDLKVEYYEWNQKEELYDATFATSPDDLPVHGCTA